MRNQLLRLTIIGLVLIIGINFSMLSCSDSAPLENNAGVISHLDNNNSLLKQSVDYSYPIWGKRNFYNKRGVWQGGTMQLSNGSVFTVENGSLTPPHPLASSVYVSMRADFDSLKNEVVVSFTPSGCVFDPPAELILDYNDLGIDIAALYYIDNSGDYIRQTPDHIDYRKKTITIYIDHFSRYAIGME